MTHNPETLWEEIVVSLVEKDYALCQGFLDDNEVIELEILALQLFNEGKFRPAGIGNGREMQVAEKIRSDHIFWLDQHTEHPVIKSFFEKTGSLMGFLNRTCFLGLQELECHLAIYPSGSRYKRHLDRFHDDDTRSISLVMYLNREWNEADGGRLVLYTAKETVTVLPKGGTLVCFRSDILEHEVLETHKTRISITGWFRRARIL